MSRRFLVAALGIALTAGLVSLAPLTAGLVSLAQSPTKTEYRSAQAAAEDSKHNGDTAKDQGRTEHKPKDTGSDKGKEDKDSSNASPKPAIATATLGGGCFWCMEAVFERVLGVTSVVSGFAGGTTRDPSYALVCTGLTGHAEVVQIEYDPSKVSYEELLSIFFAAHDPTSLNHQEDDFGTQYRSIILYHDDAQKEAALKTIQGLDQRHAFRLPIVTEVVPFTEFYPAERYHQDYFRNHSGSAYSNIHIVPKLRKLKEKLK